MSLSQLTIKKKIPIYTFFELTRRCNLKCSHCYVTIEKRKELSTDEIKGIIDQLKEENCLILNFSGGEIFTRKDFFEIAWYAKKKKFAIKIFTNGTLIDKSRAEKISDLKPIRVEITVFSVKSKIHDNITGMPGSLKKSLEALSLLSKKNVPLRIKSTLMKQNASGYKQIIELAESLGAKYQFDLNIIPRIDGLKSTLKLRVNKKGLINVLGDPKIRINEKSIFNIPPRGKNHIPCNAGHNSCAITAYGDVLPCIVLPIKLGSLRKREFFDIWHNSYELRAIRSMKWEDLKGCRICSLQNYCHRCPGLAYLEDGDISAPSKTACEVTEIQSQLIYQ